jgi:hypothetical protein
MNKSMLPTLFGRATIIAGLVSTLFTKSAIGQTLSMAGGLNGAVRCMAVDSADHRILAGGGFRFAGADSLLAKGLVAWEHDHWSIDGLADGSGDTLPAHYGMGKILFDMAMYHDTLFGVVSSDEWHYDPALVDIIYLANGEWHPCASTNNEFVELMNCNGRLFGGGGADTVAGQYMQGVKEWYGGAWHHLPNSPFTNPNGTGIYSAAYWHEHYIFGGAFYELGTFSVLSWDGMGQWETLGAGLVSGVVRTIAGFGDTLFVGGDMIAAAGQQHNSVGMWDGTNWHPFFPEVEFIGQVWDMKVYEGALYIQGVHQHDGDSTWYGLLRYDGHQLCSIGGPSAGDSGDMIFFDDTLYYGISGQYPGLEQQWIGRLPLNGLVPDQCVTPTTGMEEVAGAPRLTVLPNPASDRLTVVVPTALQTSARNVYLYDATGRLVNTSPVMYPAPLVVQLSGLVPGPYSAVVVDAQGHSLVRASFVHQP